MLQWLQRFFKVGAPPSAGAEGERQAAEWLARERGYKVIAQNWRDPRDRRDEIDLVCRDRDVLVFIEVKARSAGALVPGYYAVDRHKKKVMRRVIDAYLKQLRPAPRTFRFDVVEVVIGSGGNRPEVLHFENIPLFPKQYRG